MRILIVGGGPAGLYFGLLMKKLDSRHDITVMERDGPDDTFGWGIVFSDQTFSYLQESDEPSFREIVRRCQTWDNVDVVHRGQRISIGGNRFSSIARIGFLKVLQRRSEEVGVTLRFRTPFNAETSLAPARQRFDLVVGADGANSVLRQALATSFEPSLDARPNKYIWLGTPRLFHGLTLTFRVTHAGVWIAHSYKFSDDRSTFIVECAEETWRRAGLHQATPEETCAHLERVFADDLAEAPLLTNDFVKWLNFVLVRNRRWHASNVVLLGDALHTAHFSIGSGTKLALEDAISLAACFGRREGRDLESVLREFEEVRRPVVEGYQAAAEESLAWFEAVERDADLPPIAFAYRLMTRSKRVDRDKLRQRDPGFVAAYEQWEAGVRS
jgi:anthraniloyl-CoA monooxygenase